MKKHYPVFAGILSVILALCMVGCGGETEKTPGGDGGSETSSWYDKEIWMTASAALPTAEAVLPTSASLNNVAVHDPSVFYDDVTQKYYAFGTHFAVASSSDLITWNQLAGDNNWQALYDKEDPFVGPAGRSWPRALEKSVTAAAIQDKGNDTISTTWAPDVMKIGSRYYMYYSITDSFGSSKSLIGRVSSRNIMGPYNVDEIIVQSFGMGGQPNCIDPELFYDKDGKLWMVYGSYFTGIFIKALDQNGAPVVTDPNSDDYYGTLLWKGGSGTSGGKVVEGPFVFYNAETDYYYLMTTYGDLSSDYNMRVARSKSPTGPYTDMVANHDLTRYSDDNGVKLAGNYQFKDGATNTALGHNSVIKKDGKYLVVCHVRSAVGGMHHLEVRQLYFNKDGWPVMSPNRYVGESAGTVTEEKLVGNYDVIVHTKGTSKEYAHSEAYSLTADGKIMSGETEAGTWSLSQGYYCTITLGGITYNGVVAPGWRDYGTQKGVYCMTATSDAGLPIWLNGAD